MSSEKLTQQIKDFLDKQRVCVLTTLLADGMPHSAAMHFSYQDDPFEILVVTKKDTRKVEVLRKEGAVRAAVAIGWNEEKRETLQLEGWVEVVAEEDLALFNQVHYDKFPEFAEGANSDERFYLRFTPTWWRFSSFDEDPRVFIEWEK